jgi:transcriptional regulator with XRE-family HTH domain
MEKDNNQIKQKLSDAGITRAQVARHVGVSLATVHNWLSAGRPIPTPKLRAINELLNGQAPAPARLDQPIAFEVRLTPSEYDHLCQLAGLEKLDAEAAARQMQKILQESWNMLAARAKNVVTVDSGDMEAAEPEA